MSLVQGSTVYNIKYTNIKARVKPVQALSSRAGKPWEQMTAEGHATQPSKSMTRLGVRSPWSLDLAPDTKNPRLLCSRQSNLANLFRGGKKKGTLFQSLTQ